MTDDSSTLVVFSIRLRRAQGDTSYHPTWPIRLIDLGTGQERILMRSDESTDAAEIRDQFGTLFRTAGRQTLHEIDDENGIQQSGDYLSLTYESIDEEIPEKRLQVVNWRSGDVALDAPFEGTCRFFGPRLLVSQENGGSRLEIWTPGERTIKPADWLAGYRDLESMIVSPDGRWLILRGSTGVWDLARGEERFKLPPGVEDAVFSPDGAQLVLVGRFERGEPGHHVRHWRILEAASGNLLREEQEALEWPDNRSPPRGPGDMRYLGDGQTVRYDQRGGATEWSPQGLRRLMEDPDQEEPAEELPLEHWRVVAESENRKWAVAANVQPITMNFYGMVASDLFPKWLAYSDSPYPYQLWSREERSLVADLGYGSSELCWFTPNGLRVVTQSSDRELLVWDIPPGLPWGRALAWSLTVPLAAGAWRLLREARSQNFRRRRDNSGTSAAPAAS